MAFAAGVSVVSSVAFGLLPALQARRINLVDALTEDSLAPVGGSTRTRTARTRALIMAGQVAVASVLLIGASLLIRSFVALWQVDRGYDVTNVLTARLPLPDAAFTPVRRAQLLAAVLDRLQATPGVTRAAFTTVLPLSSIDQLLAFNLPPSGRDGRSGPGPVGDAHRQPALLRLARHAHRRRAGVRRDRHPHVAPRRGGQPRVRPAVSRQRGARAPPAGRPGPRRNEQQWEVVGVVDDVRMRNLTDPAQPEIFVSFAQLTSGVQASDPTIVVRTAGDAAAFVPRLREAVRQEDPRSRSTPW